MAGARGSKGGRRPKPSQPARRSGAKPAASGANARPAKKRPAPQPVPVEPRFPAGPFRLGAVAGTTPGKWIDIWTERMPHTRLELVPLTIAAAEGVAAPGQVEALRDGIVDAALVRLPIDREGLHAISLYDEVPVVVCAAESHLSAAEELTFDDLAGEVLIVPRDDVLNVTVPGGVAPRFAPPKTTEEAIATVAAGVGVVIVPMSLARLHHRKDAEYRPLVDGPTSTVALAWPREDASALVEVFVGIVRGRSANSSRG